MTASAKQRHAYHLAAAYRFTLERDAYRAKEREELLYPYGSEAERRAQAVLARGQADWCEAKAEEHAAKAAELGKGADSSCATAP